jgi:putative zinc finger/helix-turn-helix YgiT family protein
MKHQCPKCKTPLEVEQKVVTVAFRGEDLRIDRKAYVCPSCGMEAGTVQSVGALQRAIADAYRRRKGLLTGDEIRSLRNARGMTQEQLAGALSVGVASIKRWETGAIQTESMDRLLRSHLEARGKAGGTCSGDRPFSVERAKLVLLAFERQLRRKLLRKSDRFLYSAKYLWYADMLAFAHLDMSMTGASYAALPHGPQLNNYRDLVDPIRQADESAAAPLTPEEGRIIAQIAAQFPTDMLVYDAAHREPLLDQFTIGSLIPYSCSSQIQEITVHSPHLQSVD